MPKMWEKRKNGFHRGKQISVVNWVKKFAYKFKNIPKKCEKVYILELDEMCVSIYSFGLL